MKFLKGYKHPEQDENEKKNYLKRNEKGVELCLGGKHGDFKFVLYFESFKSRGIQL